MTAKAFDLERLSAELKLWDAELDHLEEKIRRAEPDAQAALPSETHDTQQRLEADVAKLRQLRDEAEQALQRMQQAGEPEWKILAERAERALARLGEAFEQSRAEFGE
jgi:Skp family chaperone for outer membrane proteins